MNVYNKIKSPVWCLFLYRQDFTDVDEETPKQWALFRYDALSDVIDTPVYLKPDLCNCNVIIFMHVLFFTVFQLMWRFSKIIVVNVNL